MNTRPRVALLIESSRAYGRGLLRGIAAFARAHGAWEIYQHERSLGDPAPSWFAAWRGDGVIARVDSPKLAEQLAARELPTVDLRGRFDMPGVPLVETNDRRVMQLAMDHLYERGFRRLAFCGYAGANYSACRLRMLRELTADRGVELDIYDGPAGLGGLDTTALEWHGLQDGETLGQWLAALPKPIGLIACNDTRGRQVLTACRERGVKIPDELAVIGVDNDEVLCELSDPPMSSVEPDTVRIGYAGAALLQQMLEGGAPPPRKTYIDPLGVVARRSTDVLAIDDRAVAEALRFIREHACDGIQVTQVLQRAQLSRSSLERRFARCLNSSPKAEIIRVRLERVKQLLMETDYPLARIADIAGFRHAEYMSTLFREKLGQTPGQYRESTRRAAPPARHFYRGDELDWRE